MKLRFRPFVLCLAAALTLSSCAPKQGSESTYSVAFTVRDVPSPFSTLAHGGPHLVATTFLFDTLVWKDEKGFVPLLAEKWQASDDRKTYTFTIRPGVLWHDGKPMTSADVKFTFDYLSEKPLTSSAGGAKAVIERVGAPDGRTVVFYLKEPTPDFIGDVAGQMQILPQHIWQNVADPLKFQEPAAFIGTGPFKFKETRRGEFHIFEANTSYFLGRPVVDRLIFKNSNNPVLALESGDVDAAAPSTPAALANFGNRDDFEIVTGPYSYYLTKVIFNVTRAPFNSKDLRQAVAYSLDRREIVKQVLNGEGIVSSTGLVHPDSAWFANELPKYERDLKKAEELFARAGYGQKDTDGVREDATGRKLSFTLFTRSDSQDMVRAAEMIRDQLGQAGVQLDIKPLNTGPQENVLITGEFDIAFDSHGGTISFSTPGTNPDFPAKGYKSDDLNKYYKAFMTSLGDDQRREAAFGIQRLIADDLPSLPVYNPTTKLVFRKSKGVRWYWTKDGLNTGAPIWWNKLALLKKN